MEPENEAGNFWPQVGAFGRYQMVVLFVRLLTSFSIVSVFVFNTLSMIEPTWACGEGGEYGSDCDVYNTCNSTDLRWQSKFISEIQEWQLICDLNYIPNAMLSMQYVTNFLGYLAGGPLSDGVGRKPTTLVSLAVIALSGLGNAFAATPLQFLVARAVSMFAYGTCQATVSVWFMEQTSADYNVIMNALSIFSWDLILSGGLMAWLTAEWRRYLLISSAIAVVVVCVTTLLVEESPRWLLRKGKVERVHSLLNRISARNRRPNQLTLANVQLLSQAGDIRATQVSFKALLTPAYLKPTLVLGVCFVTGGCNLATVLLELGNVGGSVYVNFCLAGAIRVAALLLLVALNRKWPRFSRLAFFVLSLSATALSFGLIICGLLLPVGLGHALVSASGWSGAMAGVFLAFTALNQLLFDIYPVLARGTVMGVMFSAGAVAMAVVPYIIYTKHWWVGAPPAINLLLLCVSLALGLAVLPQHMRHHSDSSEEQPLLARKHKDSVTTHSSRSI